MEVDSDNLEMYLVEKDDFVEDDIKVFVDSIMSKKISALYIQKCILAIGVYIELSEEEYMDGEPDENGEEFATNDFFDFVEKSMQCLVFEKDTRSWILSFRNLLLEMENYELLNILKLEKKWRI